MKSAYLTPDFRWILRDDSIVAPKEKEEFKLKTFPFINLVSSSFQLSGPTIFSGFDPNTVFPIISETLKFFSSIQLETLRKVSEMLQSWVQDLMPSGTSFHPSRMRCW